MSFQDRCLEMQGFGYMTADQKRAYAPLLRFTPAACTSLVLFGLVIGSPVVLAVTAAIALFGSLMPTAHPLDIFYNRVLRHPIGTAELPANPAPRRFAAGIKSAPLFVAAAALAIGNAPIAYGIGVFLAIVGATAAITYWDLGSWLYRVGIERRSVALFPVIGQTAH